MGRWAAGRQATRGSDGPVAFLHVPKTAGSSYTDFLAAGLPGRHLIERLEGADASTFLGALDPDELRAYRLVAGHFDFGLCVKADFLRPVTVLRHPVDRLASWYHHLLRSELTDDLPWREVIERRGLSVTDFVSHPTIQRIHGQAMTEQMAGYGFSAATPPDAEETLALAKRHLATCAHLGIFERLAESVELARAELDLEGPSELPRRNIGPDPQETVTAELRVSLEPAFGLDTELYAWAVEQFDARLAARGITARTEPGDPRTSRGTIALDPRSPSPDDPTGDPTPPRPGAAVTGDWIELGWHPSPGTSVGALLSDRPNAAAVPFDRVAAAAGGTFTLDEPGPHGAGHNWVRVPRGVYHAQLTVDCSPEQPAPTQPWTVLITFLWCGAPPLPGAPGIPGAPEVEVWRQQTVPPGLPERPRRGTPVSTDALIRVPEDDGHLTVVLGSSAPIRTRPGDGAALLYVRIG